MWEVETGNRLFRLTVVKVLSHLTAGQRERTIRVCKSLGERIGSNEAKAMRRSLTTHELERVVGGISHSWIIVDEPLKLRKRLDGCSHRRVVVVVLKIWIGQPGDSKAGQNWTVDRIGQVRCQIVCENVPESHELCGRLIE